jgi:hypothetical protein
MNENESQDDFDWKLNTLYDGIVFYSDIKEYDKAAELIEIANEMQGHNAPQTLTISIDDASKVILKNIGINFEDSSKSKNH